MTRTVLDLNRVSAKALNLHPLAVNGGHVIIGESPYRYEWNPTENEVQSAMCMDWLIQHSVILKFSGGKMYVWALVGLASSYPCRTPAERRLAVLMAVSDMEEAG